MDNFSSYHRVLFNTIDTDCDGKVSPQDLLTRLAAVTGEELSEAEAATVVAGFDSDGDGLLEMEEFSRLVEGDDEADGKKAVREAFEMYEMEGLGVITAVSLRRMLSRLGESRSVVDCKRMIAKFDVNGDGVLCFDEFMGVAANCSAEEIRSAYRRLAMRWHPDRWAGRKVSPALLSEAKAKFQQIQQAYSVLSDARKRATYDAGFYDLDDDDVHNEAFYDFMQEMASLMAKARQDCKSHSMEELQTMLMEMAQGF